MPAVRWGLVIPVKPLSRAKTRLVPYGPAARGQLALAFASDVVAAGLACPLVQRVVVVTDDAHAAGALARLGAHVCPDLPATGLNPALSYGAQVLLGLDPTLGVAAVAADLPALRPADLDDVLGQVDRGQRGFVADMSGAGTTVLAGGAGIGLEPAFGPGSAGRHLASGAQVLTATPTCRQDVDTPDDLATALLLGLGRHTTQALSRLRTASR